MVWEKVSDQLLGGDAWFMDRRRCLLHGPEKTTLPGTQLLLPPSSPLQAC